VSGKAVVAKDGKFGVYVTDGETNASLSKGDRLEAMLPERAFELLALRRDAIIEKGGPAAKKAAATKRSAAKKTTARSTSTRSSGAAKKAPRSSS
jgi:DNA topoisomerase-1